MKSFTQTHFTNDAIRISHRVKWRSLNIANEAQYLRRQIKFQSGEIMGCGGKSSKTTPLHGGKQEYERHFQDNVKRDKTGRYSVTLPFNERKKKTRGITNTSSSSTSGYREGTQQSPKTAARLHGRHETVHWHIDTLTHWHITEVQPSPESNVCTCCITP